MGLLHAWTFGPWTTGRIWRGWEGFLGPSHNALHFLALVRTINQEGGTASAGVQGHLAEGEHLAPGLEELALVAAHMKCTHCQFGHLLHAHISGHSFYNHCGFGFLPGSFTFSISQKGTEVAGWHDSWATSSVPRDWRWRWFFWPETCTGWPTAWARCPGSWAPFGLCYGECPLPWWCLLSHRVRKGQKKVFFKIKYIIISHQCFQFKVRTIGLLLKLLLELHFCSTPTFLILELK